MLIEFGCQNNICDHAGFRPFFQPGTYPQGVTFFTLFRTVFAVHILWTVSEPAEDHLAATARHEIRRRHHLLFQSCQRGILEKILCHVVLSGPVSEKGRQKGRSLFRDHGLILFLIYILGVEGLSDYVLFPLCLGETRNSVLFHLLFSEKM